MLRLRLLGKVSSKKLFKRSRLSLDFMYTFSEKMTENSETEPMNRGNSIFY